VFLHEGKVFFILKRCMVAALPIFTTREVQLAIVGLVPEHSKEFMYLTTKSFFTGFVCAYLHTVVIQRLNLQEPISKCPRMLKQIYIHYVFMPLTNVYLKVKIIG
jgi:hypothetical protein